MKGWIFRVFAGMALMSALALAAHLCMYGPSRTNVEVVVNAIPNNSVFMIFEIDDGCIKELRTYHNGEIPFTIAISAPCIFHLRREQSIVYKKQVCWSGGSVVVTEETNDQCTVYFFEDPKLAGRLYLNISACPNPEVFKGKDDEESLALYAAKYGYLISTTRARLRELRGLGP